MFKSFWLAGFESACHVNSHGVRQDLVAATQHDVQVREDFALMRAHGFHTIREGVNWPLMDQTGHFNFDRLGLVIEAALANELQVIWTLCHYGWPDDVDVFDVAFVERFAAFSEAVAKFVIRESGPNCFFSPVNEISFLAWAADVGIVLPSMVGRGNELKAQLIRAAVASCDAILSVDSRSRLIHVDPLSHVVPPLNRPDLAEAARLKTESQFEAFDMLAGYRSPELGGDPRFLDILGVNFYHSNQWEHDGQRLRWEDSPRDARWAQLSKLLENFHNRYARPVFIGETSHFGVGRAPWIREIVDEVVQAQARGVPLVGICLYPIIDRPDWDDAAHWHNSGVWDLVPDGKGTLRRILNEPYARELKRLRSLAVESDRAEDTSLT